MGWVCERAVESTSWPPVIDRVKGKQRQYKGEEERVWRICRRDEQALLGLLIWFKPSGENEASPDAGDARVIYIVLFSRHDLHTLLSGIEMNDFSDSTLRVYGSPMIDSRHQIFFFRALLSCPTRTISKYPPHCLPALPISNSLHIETVFLIILSGLTTSSSKQARGAACRTHRFSSSLQPAAQVERAGKAPGIVMSEHSAFRHWYGKAQPV